MAEFSVRQMTSPEEVAYAINLEREEGWQPGLDDAECNYAADPTGYFVGELDGKKISTVSVIKWNSFAYVASYVVEKPFRGKGYGLKTFSAGLASVDKSYNLGLDAIVEYSYLYERHGFRKAWTDRRFKIDASKALTCGTSQPQPTLTVKSIAEINFGRLAKYDAKVFGAPRHSFLKKWITAPHAKGFATVDVSGELLGYTVIRKTLVGGDDDKIGPLFADGLETARTLFLAAAEVASTTPDSSNVIIDVPIDLNPPAAKLAEEFGGVPVFDCYRMYTKGVPEFPWTTVFGVTSMELG